MNKDRVWWGLVLIAVGVVFLADRMGAVDAWPLLAGWWPLAVIAAGLLRLTSRPPDLSGAAVVTAIGLLLLAWRQDLLPENLWAYVLPVGLIVAGIILLLHRGGSSDEVVLDHHDLDVKVVAGARELKVTGERFRGGRVEVTAGGIELDLREALLPPEGAVLVLRATLGGIEVILPAGWDIEVTAGSTVLGGTEQRIGPAAPGAPSLQVHTEITLGGIELHTDARAPARGLPDSAPYDP